MQLTKPTQTIVHPDEESSYLLSTVWLREGDVLMVEMAMFPVNEYTGDVDYGSPVFTYAHHADTEAMPPEAMSVIQSIGHNIMLNAFHASKGQTIEQRGKAMVDAYFQATTSAEERNAG